MPRSTVVALAMFASLAVTGVATTAHAAAAAGASQAAGCFVEISPQQGSLPSNAPALIVMDRSAGATATVTAELVSADGRVALVGPTKDAHGITIVQLASPVAGNYTIATKVACTTGGDDRTTDTPLVLTAPVTFPSNVGTLAVRPTSPAQAGVDEIVLDATPELRAFLPVSVFKMSVNGAGATSVVPTNVAGNTGLTLSAHTGGVCVENGSLHREKRTVKVTVSADIAGLAESPAPATLDVTVDCGAIRWTSDSDYNKVTPGGSTPGTSSGSNPNNTSTGTGGCTAAPGMLSTTAANAGALMVGMLAVVAGLRRRRASRAA